MNSKKVIPIKDKFPINVLSVISPSKGVAMIPARTYAKMIGCLSKLKMYPAAAAIIKIILKLTKMLDISAMQ